MAEPEAPPTPLPVGLPEGFWDRRSGRSLPGQVMVAMVPSALAAVAVALGVGFGSRFVPGLPEPAGIAIGLVVGTFLALALAARVQRRLVGERLRDAVEGVADNLGPLRARALEAVDGDELDLLAAAVSDLSQEAERGRHELANQRRLLQKGVERETDLLARRNLELGRAKREAEGAVKALQQAQSRLVQQERMATLGQLLAGIAHEINNPVNYMVNSIRPLQNNVGRIGEIVEGLGGDEGEHAEVRKLIRDIESAVGLIKAGADRTAAIVQNLRTFSRSGSEQYAPFDLREGIALTLELLRPAMKGRVEIIEDYVEVRSVECIQGEINQVFMNILSNAVQAIPEEGAIRITVRPEELGIACYIEDSGVGMNAETAAHIFEPFFTTKAPGEGTGLGLSISYNIVASHGGTLEVESGLGVGSKFRLWLPYERAPSPAKSSAAHPRPTLNEPTIQVV